MKQYTTMLVSGTNMFRMSGPARYVPPPGMGYSDSPHPPVGHMPPLSGMQPLGGTPGQFPPVSHTGGL